MKRLVIIFLLIAAALLTACRQHHDPSDDFKFDESIRLEIKGYTIFRYDPARCQIGFNRDRCEFRVHTDNMSDFYIIRLDDIPSAAGQTVSGTASWTTGDNLHSKKTSFEVIRLEGGKIWLWSSTTRIAAVVMELE